MRLLAIETSCDETAAAVVEDGRHILSNVVSTQTAIHAPFGGVVPELASRHHLENICPVVSQAMADAGLEYANLDAVAVTQGPGLVGSLLVGLQVAKAIAFVHGKPLVPVHHIAGHIQAPFLAHGDDPPAGPGPRGLGWPHQPLPRARGGTYRPARPHTGRRRRRGVRQGRQAPWPRLSRRAGHRPAVAGRQRSRRGVHAWPGSRTAGPTSPSAGSRPRCSTT